MYSSFVPYLQAVGRGEKLKRDLTYEEAKDALRLILRREATDVPYQISGFFHANYIERIRSTQTGTDQSWMIKGEEGSIETAAGRRTPIYGASVDNILTLSPKDVGLAERERIEVEAAVDKHAAINYRVLDGQPDPATDQVALTAGTILSLIGLTSSVPTGYDHAQQLLRSGKVKETYQAISTFSI